MQYRDKSTNRTMVLNDSRTHFLALAAPDDHEALHTIACQRVFSVTPSTNNDGVFILQIKSEQESPVEVEKALGNIRANPGVRNLTPAVVDAEGITRYVLPNRVVVRFRAMTDRAVGNYLKTLKSSVIKKYRSPGLYEVAVPADLDLTAFIDKLNENDNVRFAEPNFYAVEDQEIQINISSPETTPLREGEIIVSEDQSLPWNLRVIAVPQA